MDFKSLIAKIESIDGKIETPAAPKLADPIFLSEDASMRVLAGVTALSEELQKVGDKTTTSKGGTVTKTEKGVKHEKKDDYDGSDHSDDAQKKPSKAAKSASEKTGDRAADKKQDKDSKAYEKEHGAGSVTRVKDGKKVESLGEASEKQKAAREKFLAMVDKKKGEKKDDAVKEAKKPVKKATKVEEGEMPMTTVNGKKVPAFAADGKGKNDLGKGKDVDDEADDQDSDKDTDSKGLTAKQKKLPPGLQKAIAAKSESKVMPKGKKRAVAESVEQKLNFRDMIKLVQESGGQQQIDPVDQALWSWANRVAATKVQESAKAEIFAAMIYERNGGVFEMYDVLSETQK